MKYIEYNKVGNQNASEHANRVFRNIKFTTQGFITKTLRFRLAYKSRT